MKVSYIRKDAFATNSSSTHTPVIVSGKLPEDYLIEECDFGWAPFVAASEEAKRKYAGTALLEALKLLGINVELAVSIVKDWAGVTVSPHAYIDHESIPMIPLTFDRKLPHRQFFDDALKWFLNPQLVMLGGNDNDHNVPEIKNSKEISMPIPTEQYHARCRLDKKGFYTILTRGGTKIRMSFEDGVDTSFSTAPELVDLKITDHCHKGCKYCYQDSNPNGKGADANQLYSIVRELAKLEVFEIAIGGGEPTTHPQFLELLRYTQEHGIVPNFSTGSLQWIDSKSFADTVRSTCGSFAYSIRSDEYQGRVIAEYAEALDKAELRGKGTLQVVFLPNTPQWELEELVKSAREHKIKITFLGFKNIGRGANFVPRYKKQAPINWKKILPASDLIGFDTVMIRQHHKELLAAGVSKWSMSIAEGTHSMYIDAVSHKIGPSSFCDPSEYIRYKSYATGRKFTSAFATFTKKAVSGETTK